MEKKLKIRQGDEEEEVEEKTRDEGKTRRSIPEDDSDKTHHLDLSIQLLKPSLRISLSYFAKCLTLLNNLENHINL
jgi:hypothetical protein